MSEWSDESSAPAPSWLWWWGPALAYAGIIFFLSSMSRLPSVPGNLSDKWEHAVAYSGLAVVVLRAIARGRWLELSLGHVTSAVLLTTAYGASDELHQAFVPGRMPDPRDLAADAIGAVIAAMAVYVVVRVRARWSGR